MSQIPVMFYNSIYVVYDLSFSDHHPIFLEIANTAIKRHAYNKKTKLISVLNVYEKFKN